MQKIRKKFASLTDTKKRFQKVSLREIYYKKLFNIVCYALFFRKNFNIEPLRGFDYKKLRITKIRKNFLQYSVTKIFIFSVLRRFNYKKLFAIVCYALFLIKNLSVVCYANLIINRFELISSSTFGLFKHITSNGNYALTPAHRRCRKRRFYAGIDYDVRMT